MPIRLPGWALTMWKRSSGANKLRSLLLVAVLILGLSACGKASGSPVEAAYTDALGRQVKLPENPRRVAALIGSFADVWCLAGGELCAAAEDAWEDFGLELPGALNIGGAHSPNPELILAANPDLVLASASTKSNVELLPTLEAAGITVVFFDVDCFEDYLAMLEVCTGITGRRDLYEQNGLALEERIRQVQEETALTEETETVLLLRASSGSVKAKGSQGTVLGQMLADLGCRNIADSDTVLLENLSVESVIAREPYRIFVVTMGSDTQGAYDNLRKMMEENPAWGELEAVREDRLHIMDKQLFNLKPNARWAEAYETLSAILGS